MKNDHQACMDACQECANACDQCATACLGEEDPKSMADCIALDGYCADICRLAVAFMARANSTTDRFAHRLCVLCAEVCDACAIECRQHPMEHCQVCAKSCEACAKACRRMSTAGHMA